MNIITRFQSIESFYTDRLKAEKIKASDLDKFINMHTNPEVMVTLGGLRTIHQIEENLNLNLKQWEKNGYGLWMFYLKNTKEWVGRGGIRRFEIDGYEEVEINYVLMPFFWNKGLATEIAQACKEVAFEMIDLDNIICFTLETNKASKRVMEKVGFQYERNITHNGLPHILYRIQNLSKVGTFYV